MAHEWSKTGFELLSWEHFNRTSCHTVVDGNQQMVALHIIVSKRRQSRDFFVSRTLCTARTLPVQNFEVCKEWVIEVLSYGLDGERRTVF